MDAWTRQAALARTTIVWSAVSLAAGHPLLRHRDPFWRGFGEQHVGWAVADLGIVAVVQGLKRRTMRRSPNPYAPQVLEDRRRQLTRVLTVNAALDVGYCLLGAAMWRRMRDNPRASGAGLGIVVQGAFLLLHDGWHAVGSARRSSRTITRVPPIRAGRAR